MKHVKVLLLLFLFYLTGHTQSGINWTQFVDLSKNGFVLTKDLNGSQVVISVNPIRCGFFIPSSADKIEKNSKTIIYQKNNQKSILLFGDFKNRNSTVEYDGITHVGLNTFIVESNHRFGVIDSLGRIIIPIKYESISPQTPNLSYKDGSPNGYKYDILDFDLEVQLFICEEDQYDLMGSPKWEITNHLIKRDNSILFSSYRKTFHINYFVSRGSLFYVISEGFRDSFDSIHIGLFGQRPNVNFDGSIVFDNPFMVSSDLFKNPLVKFVNTSNSSLFDFGSMLPVLNVPIFKGAFGYLGTEYFICYKGDAEINKPSIMILSKQLEVIAEGNYDNFYGFPIQSEHYSQSLVNLDFRQSEQFQVDNDSLLLFSAFVKSETRGKENQYGIYKIGYGEYYPPTYKSIRRISKDYCIVSTDDGDNVLDLDTLEEVFSKNFERITTDENNKNQVYIECVFEGKITRLAIQELKKIVK